MDAPEITIGKVTATLVRPRPSVALLTGWIGGPIISNPGLWYGNAGCLLRECWPESVAWPVAARPVRWKAPAVPAVYGLEIIDGLASEIPYETWARYLEIVYEWAQSTVLRAEDVKAAAPFSGDQRGT